MAALNLPWAQGVGGSNPLAPIHGFKEIQPVSGRRKWAVVVYVAVGP
jgi:hypothetical protein